MMVYNPYYDPRYLYTPLLDSGRSAHLTGNEAAQEHEAADEK
jgi:hypothetical protein